MANAESVMRIDDLVSTVSLGVRVLAGESGLSREVLWAHSCEMRDPERWLGPHELLMTVGLCVPAEPSEQVEFVKRLDTAGLAGLMIGDHDLVPQISDEMLAEADARGFPVLFVATETPYAVVSRHVAAASSSSQLLQVLKLSKLYQVAANADDDFGALVDGLATLLPADLRIVDRVTGVSVIETHGVPDNVEGRRVRSYALRGAQQADLLLFEYPGEPVESFILVHLMKVLEVMVDRLLGAAKTRVESGARALRGLLAGAPSLEAERHLGGAAIEHGYQVAAFPSSEGERVARGVALRELPVLVGPGRTSSLALIPLPETSAIRRIAEASSVRFGVSSMFTDYRDVRIAAEEATRVLNAARFSDRIWTEFEGTTVAVLSRSHREADEIIEGVLGQLAESSASATKMRETLFAYLRNDRHWQATADELGIHRQTLSYRLNRIAEETGLSVTRSADISALWIAYQAWENIHERD